MRYQIRYDGELHITQSGLEARLRRIAARRLDPLLARHGASDSTLYVTVARRKSGAPEYEIRLHLHLPGRRVAVAEAESDDLLVCATRAMDRLFREARAHFARLRREDAWRRKARRERLARLKQETAALPPATSEEAHGRLAGFAERLREIASHELACLRALGELPPGWPTVDDVVDEAIAETRSVFKPGTDAGTAWRQLLRNFYRVLDREVAAAREAAAAVSLDDPVPSDPEDQAEAMVQEEFHEFWQPDESLRMADVLPDEGLEAPPEPVGAARAEDAAAGILAEAIRALPTQWRRALLLSESEQMTAADIGEVLGVDAEAAKAWVVHAREFVSARLDSAGVDLAVLRERQRWVETFGAE